MAGQSGWRAASGERGCAVGQVGDHAVTPERLREEERAAAAAGPERWAYYAVAVIASTGTGPQGGGGISVTSRDAGTGSGPAFISDR